MWNAFGRKAVGFVVGVAVVLVLAGLSSVALAEEAPKKDHRHPARPSSKAANDPASTEPSW